MYLFRKNIKNSLGMSLIEATLGMALLGGASLATLKLAKSQKSTQQFNRSDLEILKLRKKTRLLISNYKACTRSLAGLKFRGSTISNVPTKLTDLSPGTEDMHSVVLRYVNSDNTSASPEVSYKDSDLNFDGVPANRFGNVKINAIELYMPEHTSGLDLPNTVADSPKQYFATLAIHSQTDMGNNKWKTNGLLKYRVPIAVKTSAGVSEIVGCEMYTLNNRQVHREWFDSDDYNPNPLPMNQLISNANTNRFALCGFTFQYHNPDRYHSTAIRTAHVSEFKCKLEPTGTGPLYEWRFSMRNSHGQTKCEVTCI